jgi:drug/metabolite transporter (DMT)-like permease
MAAASDPPLADTEVRPAARTSPRKLAKMTGIAFLVAGIVVMAYGGFTYAMKNRQARISSLALMVSERERVPIPVWAGVVAIVAGASLLLVPDPRSTLS